MQRARLSMAVRVAGLLWLLVGFASAAQAQTDYPDKPVRVIVGFTAGGTIDVVTRLVADKLTEMLGKPFVVENRPGASGNIASEAVAKAKPDGYTLLMGANITHTINPFLFASLPFDVQRDFTPVARIALAPNLVAANPAVPAVNLRELVALSKTRPGQLSYATAGSGSTGHLAMEMLKSTTGMDIVHVAYRGGPPAINDTLAGHTALVVFPPPGLATHIKAGKLNPIAITSLRRSPLLPDVPTVAESGFPGFEAIAWYGLFAPAGIPPAVLAKLDTSIAQITAMPDVAEKLAAQGVEIAFIGSSTFAEFLRVDSAKWSRVVKDSGAKAE